VLDILHGFCKQRVRSTPRPLSASVAPGQSLALGMVRRSARCHNSRMAFQSDFWVAAAAAAPVIALANVVTIGDSLGFLYDFPDVAEDVAILNRGKRRGQIERRAVEFTESVRRAVLVASIANLVLQALALLACLISLGVGSSAIVAIPVIIVEVLGLLLLGPAAFGSSVVRRTAKDYTTQALIERVGDAERRPNDA
jgi:hypothetical protein